MNLTCLLSRNLCLLHELLLALLLSLYDFLGVVKCEFSYRFGVILSRNAK